MSFKLLEIGRAALVAAAICVATVPSPSWAATAPDFVTNEAVFWLDASTLSQLPGQEVTSWPDVRGEGHPVASTAPNRVNPTMTAIASGSLAGKVAVDFGSLGSNKDMAFGSTLENVMMIFFVMDIDNAKYACLIGGGNSNQRFCREKQAAYLANYNQTLSYSIWTNGEKVPDPLNTATPSGYNLITYRYDGTSGFPCVGYLASDRNINGRVGGKRLCEVIGFTRVLSDSERVAVESYLRAKWFEETWSWADDVSVNDLLGMAQVHFDASVASSFHYDTEDPTKVVQWDDLSGNGNHFTAHINESYNLTKYGTVGSVTGRPVFDSGTAPSGIDLKLATRITDTRSVVMVTDIDRTQAAFWLGDSGDYTFHRGAGGSYFYYQNWNWPAPEAGGSPWCNGVAIASRDNYPDLPGHLGIYVFNMAHDSCWCYLGQDRSQTARNGGKRVAELFTFNFALPDSARKRIEDYLFEKWTPSEAYIDSIAAVHVDASSASNFNYTDADITGWKNSASGNDLVASSTYGSCGYTNGVTAFLMGQAGSGIDMTFDKLTNIRTVFWAMDIQYGVQEAFFLGCTESGIFHFHRGNSDGSGSSVGTYFSNNRYALAKAGSMYCDGKRVASSTTEKPPRGMHVFDLASSADLTASSLSNDRTIVGRNGGRAISELLILTNEVWGLTRAGVRRRIENKWTRKCGWAGAGDAEWGAGKYRVFDSDAVVPADGAAAVGVGFTANATLSGGTLTLGDGGFFASEGAQVAVSAPVAGKLGVYGPGAVTFTASLATVDSISVGYGSTLVLPADGTVVAGGLSMLENAKLVLDVSALAARQHASITFSRLSLPAGGSLYDYVSLVGGEERGHVLTVTENAIHVNSPDVAAVAVWTASQNTNVENPANWSCWNFNGEPVANVIPEVSTTSVTFNADCDLRTLGRVAFANGVAFDLNGHAVKIAGLAAQGYSLASVTNSDANATAELRIDVANGLTITNATVVLGGNMNFVKDGAGTFVAAKARQTYVGVNEVTNGVLEVAYALRDSRNYLFGAKGNSFLVRTGATFKMNAMYAQADAVYKFVLDGGRLLGSYEDVAEDNGQIHLIELTKDSTFEPTTNCGLVPGGGFNSTELDLGGHTLTVPIGTNDKIFYLFNTTVKNGKVNITSGGWLKTRSGYTVTATNADFRVGSAMRILGPMSVRDYEPAYDSDYNDGTAAFNVYGTFRPAAGHNCFYGCTMQNGSTIDLSSRTSALPLTSSFTTGRNTIDFAANAKVTVDLSGRADVAALAKSGDYVVTWTESTAPGADVTFRLDAATAAKYTLKADATGLRLGRGGFMLIVR